MENEEMSMALSGNERFTMNRAAKLLGVCYETVRRYVIERKEVPSERRGKPRNPNKAHGCKVLIDEHGLQKLREILPPDPDVTPYVRSEPASPQSSSTATEPGLSGSP